MSSNAPQSGVPITEAMLAEYRAQARGWLLRVKGTLPDTLFEEKKQGDKSGVDGLRSFKEGKPSLINYDVEPLKLAQRLSGDSELVSEGIYVSLQAMQTGLMLGIHVAQAYMRASNLDTLIGEKNRNALAPSREAELSAKLHTASVVAVYVTAAYVLWKLSQYKSEEVAVIRMDPPRSVTLSLSSTLTALGTLVLNWAVMIEKSGLVATDLQFVKATMVIMKKVIEDILERKDTLSYADTFTAVTYQLVGTQFSISGFQSDVRIGQGIVEFKKIPLSSIVGNRDAKHFVRRLAQRLVCYDPTIKKNVFHEIGGISRIAMGFGPPGTGKSMLIGAMATLISDYCEALKMPFLYHPFPDTMVSTFQGGSAERAAEWFRPLADTSRVVYAPIDDAENTLEDRTRQGVSSGVREVIGVFLRKTEGAEAIDRGNTAIHVLTNIPDQIDPAVRSRIVSRFLIDGAQTEDDFLDQDYLWWRRYQTLDSEFINLTDPVDYEYLAAQREVTTAGALYVNYAEPREDVVKEVLARADKKCGRNQHRFFSVLYKEFQKVHPMFTSRDLRNIQSAVSERITDFDLPEVWFEKPDEFFGKEYEVRKKMLIEIMKASMNKLSFADIRFQESIRYLDGWVKIQDQGFERRVKEFMDHVRVQNEGTRRLKLVA